MTNDKFKTVNGNVQSKKYDLEDRTLRFAKECIDILKTISKDSINGELVVQAVRATASVGANYREANNTISKKDFYHRIGICRREAKESKYWLELLAHSNQRYAERFDPLIDEALQLARIFASISKNGS